MKTNRLVSALFREIVKELDSNSKFGDRIHAVVQEFSEPKARPAATTPAKPAEKRPSNRRNRAVIDPVMLARQSEDVLKTELATLDIEQLRDVVAEYGMDGGKVVMKWKDKDRVIERVVEISRLRAQKGSAFREHGGEAQPDRSETDTAAGAGEVASDASVEVVVQRDDAG